LSPLFDADAHALRWASEFSQRENCHLSADLHALYKAHRILEAGKLTAEELKRRLNYYGTKALRENKI